jgi:hypothetical protein
LMAFQLAEGYAQWRDGIQSAPQSTICFLEDLITRLRGN